MRYSLPLAAAVALLLTSCADAPTAAPVADARAAIAAPAGTYELSFRAGGSDVTTVPVGSEVGVRATVRNSLGALVTGGSVTFERCEVGSSPAPVAACDGGGTGTWKRYMSVRMDPSGFPPTVYGGTCSNPTTIGFRFRYSPGKEQGIAAGASVARDISWVPAA